ncbi:fibrinogen-like protein 1 [Cyprinodon tularosa]|uniref:fibrinogen-like protein 1 n=1 Tax=Cyprinodon tularosa TaxID=77115 RepID=UPI0018E1ECF9|nr:fibrinogen-like protein 1 [Cyprinodon tularosa]
MQVIKSLLGSWGLMLMLQFCCLIQAEEAAFPEDCTQIKKNSSQEPSGVYEIQPAGVDTHFKVYCEMGQNEGWIVIQRRTGGQESFHREWEEYKRGFGSLANDHWLGLEKVHLLTKNKTKKWTLKVDLWDHEGGMAFAEYNNFTLGDEQKAYKLEVGRYSGNAGDAIRGSKPRMDQNGFGFSTIDSDHDGCSPCIFDDIAEEECAASEGGGWWYSRCGSAALNGDWHPSGDHIYWVSGLHWHTWKPVPYSAKATRMMIKPE